MKKEVKTVCYDEELNIEAYCFEGTRRPFPNHFHDYYVIGFVEAGVRCLSCRNRDYMIQQGDILLFHPYDNHECAQSDGGTFDYQGITIPKDTMLSLAEEITGERSLLKFSQNVIVDGELSLYLKTLHQLILSGGERFEKEELLFLLISMLTERYGQPVIKETPVYQDEMEAACRFMEEHYGEHIALEQLCACSKLSKSTLLRVFTKSKGVTPYRYLQSIRIGKAKKMLEDGVSPVEAALQTGFADQSHFTNFFHTYIGISPATYRRMFRKRDGVCENGE